MVGIFSGLRWVSSGTHAILSKVSEQRFGVFAMASQSHRRAGRGRIIILCSCSGWKRPRGWLGTLQRTCTQRHGSALTMLEVDGANMGKHFQCQQIGRREKRALDSLWWRSLGAQGADPQQDHKAESWTEPVRAGTDHLEFRTNTQIIADSYVSAENPSDCGEWNLLVHGKTLHSAMLTHWSHADS